jgi:hypothetical protein
MGHPLVVSVLTNGAAVAVVTWFLNSREAKKSRQADMLRSQLEWFYGPLTCQLRVNAMVLRHANNLSARAHKEYGPDSGHNWENEHLFERLSAAGTAVIEINNDYARLSIEANDAIVTLIKVKYHHIDPTDQPYCNAFILNDARFKTELSENKKTRIPLEIYDHDDPILYDNPAFLKAIETTFARKQAQLAALVAPSWPTQAWRWLGSKFSK